MRGIGVGKSWMIPSVASCAVGAAAFALLPAVPLGSVVAWGGIARALVCGSAVGLLLFAEKRWVAPLVAVLAAMFGALLDGLAGVGFGGLPGLAAALAVAGGGGWLWAALARVLGARGAGIGALAIVLAASVWFSGVLPGPLAERPAQMRAEQLSSVPQPETYRFDGSLYLRTYYLMKVGERYYPAFRQAVIDDARHDASFLTSPFNYREPLVFELWRLLPGSHGYDLFAWFVVWGLATMVAAYWLASDLVTPGAALLAPVLLVRFFSFFWWADRTWFAITEVWAAGLVVAAVAALIRGHRPASIVLLTLAVAAREFAIVMAVAWIGAWWFADAGRRRQSAWFPATALLAPLLTIAAHVASVPPLAAGGTGISAWLHGSPERLLGALMFAWSPLAHGTSYLALAIALAALACAFVTRPTWKRAALVAAVLSVLAFLVVFSGGDPWLYWGACFTPLFAALAPGVLGRLFPPEAGPAGSGRGAGMPMSAAGDPRRANRGASRR